MTRYKIVKKTSRNGEDINEYYNILKEVKRWYRSKPTWKYCREFTYASYDSARGERVRRGSLKTAEEYVKNMMNADNIGNTSQDIKIYECRNSKIDKLLDN